MLLQLQLPQLGDVGEGGLQEVIGGKERQPDHPGQRDDHDRGDLQSAARSTFHKKLAVDGQGMNRLCLVMAAERHHQGYSMQMCGP